MVEPAHETQAERQRWPRSITGKLSRILYLLLWLSLAVFTVGSAVFIYQESQSRGLPFLGGPPASGTPAAGRVTGEKLAHQNGPCTSCHSASNRQARLYLALDGRDAGDNLALTVRAGQAFQLAFHFEGLLGDAEKFQGVGVEVLLPYDPKWTLGQGSGKPVEGWSASGGGRSFWSPAWSRTGAGPGGRGGRWLAVQGQPGAFYLDSAASPWAVAGITAAANDRGGAEDGDGRADAMGADAVVGVPLTARPGRYELVVAAIGHDARGERAQATRRVTVQVEGLPPPPAPPARGVPFRPPHGPTLPCGTCHRASKKVTASHEGMTNDQCTLCHRVANTGPPAVGAARIPHASEGRAECLSCHGERSLRPAPADHAGRLNTICTLCHHRPDDRSAMTPGIPHATEGRAACTTCHTSSGFIRPLPASHERRPNEMCIVCHAPGDTWPSPGAPPILHSTAGRVQCLACHARGFLAPIPADHRGRSAAQCTTCHEPVPRLEAPGRPRDIPHPVEERSNCLVCHGPSGLRPVPASHVGRQNATCAACHLAPASLASRTAMPHQLAGRQDCLACHSSFFVPPVTGSHDGRTDETCTTCHLPRPPAAP